MTFHFGFDLLHRNYTVILVLNQCNDNTLKSTMPQRNRVSIFTFTSLVLSLLFSIHRCYKYIMVGIEKYISVHIDYKCMHFYRSLFC